MTKFTTKRQLIARVADELCLDESVVNSVIDAFHAEVLEDLMEGFETRIGKLGIIKPRHRSARDGVKTTKITGDEKVHPRFYPKLYVGDEWARQLHSWIFDVSAWQSDQHPSINTQVTKDGDGDNR
jgi:nucleoid DNA-binding protein